MGHRQRRGGRVDATGRSIGSGHHVRFYRWELESPAYRSLSIGSRALLVELKSLYTGNNNGALFLSVRKAGEKLGGGKTLAAALFLELQDRGFIRPKVEAGFNWKTAARARKATCWILTEYPIGEAHRVGSRDFMHWRPPEKQSTVRPRGQTVRPRGQIDKKEPQRGESVRPHGQFTPRIVDRRSAPADTVNIPREVA
jgi:hypothetical protein